MKLFELFVAIGITLPNVSILKKNKARAIRFSTMDAICREFDSQPGDLLEYVPDHDGSWGEPITSCLVKKREDEGYQKIQIVST